MLRGKIKRNKMILKNKGIKTDKYYIPPFDLNEGEIVVLNLFGGQHFQETKMYLKDIFTGKIPNENITINRRLTFVEHFIEPKFRRLFYPVTVGEFLKRNANSKSDFVTKIYDIERITKKRKVNTLPGNSRKLLCMYATLSNTKDIIFDLGGQDPQGAEETYQIVKDNVKKGGSAIFLDWTADRKDDCTKYIELELTEQEKAKIIHKPFVLFKKL